MILVSCKVAFIGVRRYVVDLDIHEGIIGQGSGGHSEGTDTADATEDFEIGGGADLCLKATISEGGAWNGDGSAGVGATDTFDNGGSAALELKWEMEEGVAWNSDVSIAADGTSEVDNRGAAVRENCACGVGLRGCRDKGASAGATARIKRASLGFRDKYSLQGVVTTLWYSDTLRILLVAVLSLSGVAAR